MCCMYCCSDSFDLCSVPVHINVSIPIFNLPFPLLSTLCIPDTVQAMSLRPWYNSCPWLLRLPYRPFGEDRHQKGQQGRRGGPRGTVWHLIEDSREHVLQTNCSRV